MQWLVSEASSKRFVLESVIEEQPPSTATPGVLAGLARLQLTWSAPSTRTPARTKDAPRALSVPHLRQLLVAPTYRRAGQRPQSPPSTH